MFDPQHLIAVHPKMSHETKPSNPIKNHVDLLSTINTTCHYSQPKSTFTGSMGVKTYFPNKTTNSSKNRIVQMIL